MAVGDPTPALILEALALEVEATEKGTLKPQLSFRRVTENGTDTEKIPAIDDPSRDRNFDLIVETVDLVGERAQQLVLVEFQMVVLLRVYYCEARKFVREVNNNKVTETIFSNKLKSSDSIALFKQIVQKQILTPQTPAKHTFYLGSVLSSGFVDHRFRVIWDESTPTPPL